jgi:hypothetical protein
VAQLAGTDKNLSSFARWTAERGCPHMSIFKPHIFQTTQRPFMQRPFIMVRFIMVR